MKSMFWTNQKLSLMVAWSSSVSISCFRAQSSIGHLVWFFDSGNSIVSGVNLGCPWTDFASQFISRKFWPSWPLDRLSVLWSPQNAFGPYHCALETDLKGKDLSVIYAKIAHFYAAGVSFHAYLIFVFFSCPGQLNKWHCRSVGLSVGANSQSEPREHQRVPLDTSRH